MLEDMGQRSSSLGSLAHRPLNMLAAAAAVGVLIAGVLYATDPRELLGVSLWEKPLKFLLSSVIYALTLSWFYSFTARSRRFGWWLGVSIVAFLVIELIIIVGAASLGVTSHFNVSSPLAITLWSTMATAISLTWAATFLMGALLWKSPLIPRVLREAIRWGLGIALGGMGIAFAMTPPQANQIADWQGIAGAHAVGVADGAQASPSSGGPPSQAICESPILSACMPFRLFPRLLHSECSSWPAWPHNGLSSTPPGWRLPWRSSFCLFRHSTRKVL